MDGGANTSLSNRLDIFSTYWEIDPYEINSITDDAPVQCTHRGIYHMKTKSGDYIAILMYYAPNASGIVISPTDAVIRNTKYTA